VSYYGQRNEDKLDCNRYVSQSGMSVFVVSDLDGEAVDVDEAKAHLRIDGDGENDWIENNITTARVMMEGYTGVAFGKKTINVFFERYTYNVKLPYPFVDEVTSVEINGEAATVNNQYQVTQGKRLRLKSGQENLSVTYTTIDFDGLPAGLQQAIKSCILCQLGHLYAHRGDESAGMVSSEAMAIVAPYKQLNVF
jgi:uncharacterized phiE125 gp8 family phage protein